MLGDYKAKHYTVILLGFASAYLAKQVREFFLKKTNFKKKDTSAGIATVSSAAYNKIMIIIIITTTTTNNNGDHDHNENKKQY